MKPSHPPGKIRDLAASLRRRARRHLGSLAGALLGSAAAWSASLLPEACARGHILVRFRPEAHAAVRETDGARRLEALRDRLGLPDGATLAEPAVSRALQARTAPQGHSQAPRPDLGPFLYLRLPPGLDPGECVRRLERHPLVEYAEPDWIGSAAETLPSDPEFAAQWHHRNEGQASASIQTPLAWDVTRGSSNVLVAVLDTGLADLPEFAGRVVPGYNFVSTNEITLDDHGHGTQVTGLLAAHANNGILGAGVDWHCRIMPIKVFDEGNHGFYSWWAQGIDFAVAHGCKVINLSAAGTEFGRTVQRAITNAIAQGAIFVTAAGNLGQSDVGFPGYLRDCITVGATDAFDFRADFSNSGAQLDLVAPGVALATVGLTGELEFVSGTSFSAPLVAGVCALLASLRPNLTQAEAQILLCAGAEDELGESTDLPGFDPRHGWGRLNAAHTLLLATLRIDRVRLVGGLPELSWISPPNAAQRQPFLVESRSGLGEPWMPRSDPGASRYEAGRTLWIDPEPVSATRFHRVAVRRY